MAQPNKGEWYLKRDEHRGLSTPNPKELLLSAKQPALCPGCVTTDEAAPPLSPQALSQPWGVRQVAGARRWCVVVCEEAPSE